MYNSKCLYITEDSSDSFVIGILFLTQANVRLPFPLTHCKLDAWPKGWRDITASMFMLFYNDIQATIGLKNDKWWCELLLMFLPQ